MLGLGQDFRFIKQNSDWKNLNGINGPTRKSLSGIPRDIFYDYDVI